MRAVPDAFLGRRLPRQGKWSHHGLVVQESRFTYAIGTFLFCSKTANFVNDVRTLESLGH